MKNLLSLLIILPTLTISAQTLSPDPGFGTAGIVTTSVNTKSNEAIAAEVLPDGKIVVAARSGNLNDGDIIVLRYLANGSPDNTFNGSGHTTTSVADDYVSDMKLQPDGKIVVAGYTISGDSTIALLLRYNTDGTLDKQFGDNGIVKATWQKKTLAYAICLHTDGKITAAGADIAGYSSYHALTFRVNADGTFDSKYGSKGISVHNYSGDPGRALALTFRKDSTLLTAGYNTKGDNSNFELFHINKYGITGWSDLNKEGRVEVNVKDNSSRANAIHVLDDGRILMAGTGGKDAKADFALVGLTALGKPDKAFGTGGKTITDISKSAREDLLKALLVLPDGKILAAGVSHNGELDGTVPVTDIALACYSSTGLLDNTFGQGGIAKYPASGKRYYRLNAMALQPDGKVIIAGSVTMETGNRQIFLLRVKL